MKKHIAEEIKMEEQGRQEIIELLVNAGADISQGQRIIRQRESLQNLS
ncbi:hypothetical protein ACYULU_13220 [Breznakiellaceae bacterium SP9]